MSFNTDEYKKKKYSENLQNKEYKKGEEGNQGDRQSKKLLLSSMINIVHP
jgi:hypothetical protein